MLRETYPYVAVDADNFEMASQIPADRGDVGTEGCCRLVAGTFFGDPEPQPRPIRPPSGNDLPAPKPAPRIPPGTFCLSH